MPSGQVKITVSVEGDFDLAFDGAKNWDGKSGRWRVQHQPGACLPCKANEDTANVPCAECRGNIKTELLDDGVKGNLCRCIVVWDENG